MFTRRKRQIPALNTTSTADISFMLLIFFLVTTSMDIDKGITRQLPPVDNSKEEVVTDVDKDNVLRLVVDDKNNLYVDDKPMVVDSLKQHVVAFLQHCKDVEEHVISVDVDRNASYDIYFNMQDEVVAAYHIVRDAYARKMFNHPLGACSEDEREAVVKACPQRLAEIYHTDLKNSGEGGEE